MGRKMGLDDKDKNRYKGIIRYRTEEMDREEFRWMSEEEKSERRINLDGKEKKSIEEKSRPSELAIIY